jgi:hypothetical protein
MMENTIYAQKQADEPANFTRFLWWLSTAEEELLIGAAIDSNRYSIVGMTVFTTWLFATAAWTYFFSTVTNNVLLSLPLGLLMGFIILTIDRALIKSINRQMKNRWLPIVFRIVLASVIGMFMAQPALLYMFKKEIKLQVAADNTNRQIANRQQLDSLFRFQKDGLLEEKNKLQQEAALRYEGVQGARENFLKETDGSGGTGKVGIKAIAIAKRNEYQKLDTEYQQFMVQQQPKFILIDSSLKAIELTRNKQEGSFAGYFNDGFLTQIEALQHLLQNHPALQYRYYLLMAILLLIELMPLLSKLLLPAGTYDEKVRLREALEKEMAELQILHQKEVSTLYQTAVMNHDKEMINTFFNDNKADRLEKIQSFNKEWKETEAMSFKILLQKIKQMLLISKQI